MLQGKRQKRKRNKERNKENNENKETEKQKKERKKEKRSSKSKQNISRSTFLLSALIILLTTPQIYLATPWRGPILRWDTTYRLHGHWGRRSNSSPRGSNSEKLLIINILRQSEYFYFPIFRYILLCILLNCNGVFSQLV